MPKAFPAHRHRPLHRFLRIVLDPDVLRQTGPGSRQGAPVRNRYDTPFTTCR
ncbi:hypothetical protein [Streptomyces sp. NPDC058751]|uniref:hypothetical protein n=1 Tax=Streptomyces sp. NPDC058751 TaxID=3346623 RepID=UPI0036BC9246